MQYPPQQQPPANQPYYPPSEIYQYDQPQTPIYAPQNVAPEPRQTGQEIAISYNQKLLSIYRRICTVLLIVLSVLLIGLIFLVASSFIPSLALALGTPPIESGDILPITLSFVILLVAITFLAWWVRMIGSFSDLTSKPVLHITSEGVTIQNNIMVRHRFIHWNEIEALDIKRFNLIISSSSSSYSSPSNSGQLQGRASKKIVASLFYLDTSAQEILQQIGETYAKELSYYQIQLRG